MFLTPVPCHSASPSDTLNPKPENGGGARREGCHSLLTPVHSHTEMVTGMNRQEGRLSRQRDVLNGALKEFRSPLRTQEDLPGPPTSATFAINLPANSLGG